MGVDMIELRQRKWIFALLALVAVGFTLECGVVRLSPRAAWERKCVHATTPPERTQAASVSMQNVGAVTRLRVMPKDRRSLIAAGFPAV